MNDKVLRNLSYGMYVIGAKDDKPVGCIANTVVQITSNPKTIALSINHDNYTNEIIKKTGIFSVSILDETINPEIIGIFGYKSSKDINKYENINTYLLEGMPVLKQSCGNIICKVINTQETTTHTIFLGEVIIMDNYNEEIKPMTYRYYHEVLKGKSPKKAPTYEEIKEETKSIWKCETCGYEIEADDLPEDFTCPVCGEPRNIFKKIN